MTPRIRRRLRGALAITAFTVVVSLLWDYGTSRLAGEPNAPGVALTVGLLLAIPLILVESTALAGRFRRLSFPAAVLAKTSTYVGLLGLIFLGRAFVVGALQGRSLEEFQEALPQLLAAMVAASVLYAIVIFLRQLNSLLGPGVLLRFVTGRYHAPRRERRIFMFVDLEGSTELASRLSMEHYYGLVNDFFLDVADPVVDSEGEIYEYVGDEVVISWPYEAGLRNANCVRAFFEIQQAVSRESDEYLQRYGAVPRFKAGLHEGEVIVAEMGGVKKVIAFNGEVLNVTARIQGECGRLGKRLLASRELVDGLSMPSDLMPESMGLVALRGAGEREIVALA